MVTVDASINAAGSCTEVNIAVADAVDRHTMAPECRIGSFDQAPKRRRRLRVLRVSLVGKEYWLWISGPPGCGDVGGATGVNHGISKISMMNNGESIDSGLCSLADCKRAIQHGEFGGKAAVVMDQHFRDLMAGVCAPVAIVTTADHDGAHGATVSSLASVSLKPPLVSIALDCNSALLERILGSRRFGVNVLGRAQDDLALVFARRGVDRFSGACWSMQDGLPRVEGAVGWAVCDLHQSVEAGDHLLLIGLVRNAASSPQPPLIYGHRTFGTHSQFQQRPRKPITDHIAACAR
jgi:flavin reductase (DIM6/NTAB) family NADH-FMN oxidoreductase RutF